MTTQTNYITERKNKKDIIKFAEDNDVVKASQLYDVPYGTIYNWLQKRGTFKRVGKKETNKPITSLTNESQSLRSENENLKRTLDNVNKANKKLRAEINDLIETKNSAVDKYTDISAQLSSMHSAYKEMAKQNTTLFKIIEKLTAGDS